MRRIAQDDVTARRVLEAQGVVVVPPYAGLVIHDETGILGAVVVSHMADGDAEVSCSAGAGYWSLATIRAVMRYLFEANALYRISARCERRNRVSIRGVKKLGFKQEGVKRGRSRSHDVMLFGMKRDECRVLPRPKEAAHGIS